MTQESPKAELIFEYRRDVAGVYEGSLSVVEHGAPSSARPPLHVVVRQPEWIRFVVEQIKAHRDASRVSFMLTKPDKTTHKYQFDPRTVEKIRNETLLVEDLIL